MATDFTSIFGNYIRVLAQPRQNERQYAGIAGTHGVISMWLGTRGRQVVITGRLYGSGNGYQAARTALQSAIDAIESYLWADAASYSFYGTTYNNLVFDLFQLIADANGKAFHYTSDGYVMCDFVMYAHDLI